MNVHFIAIGGSAMHNLALALHSKGYNVTGSDDEIFEPSKSRLESKGLLPNKFGWYPKRITTNIDAVILGMHAKEDNPELIKAKELGLKIYSYPEYLYEQTKDKKRIVIGGSHGKTTVTSMILHVLKFYKKKFDFMVGAKIEGFDTMVELSNDAEIAIFEGDEYLSSPIDKRPKFHLYYPHIAVITGIAWDHINVFPTYKNYKEQFSIFTDKIEENGTLIYCAEDGDVTNISKSSRPDINKIPYKTHPYKFEKNKSFLLFDDNELELNIFGKHNYQNINAALSVCEEIGISKEMFYKAIPSFKGAAKRLQKLAENDDTVIYLDFAHSPSKLKATIKAVKEQYPERKLIACMELHTYSSLKSEFLPQYSGSMSAASEAIVYYNPETIKHKRLQEISPEQVKAGFDRENLKVFTKSENLRKDLKEKDLYFKVLLFMSSGNFDGIEFHTFAQELLTK